MIKITPSLRARFNAKIAPPNERGCALWTGYALPNGYGWFSLCRGKNEYAHRIAFVKGGGKLTRRLNTVRHTCDTPLCTTWDHLRAGTPQQNSQDRDQKNRQAKGETSGQHKLTEDDVYQIRRCIRHRIYPQNYLAKHMGVSSPTVWNIVQRNTWKHLPVSEWELSK